MILTENKKEIHSSGILETVQMGFDAHGLAFMQKMLRTGMYSDKVRSLAKEIIANSLDAHVEAGISEQPIEIFLPSRFEEVFRVVDRGNGISEEDMLGRYALLCNSTKRGSDDFIGAYGVGRLSPLCYNDSFTVISKNAGKKITYCVFVNEQEKTQISKLSEEYTKDKNGFEVIIAVKSNDIQEFHDKVFKICQYLKIKPIIHGATFEYENLNPIFSGKDWRLTGKDTGSVAIMGQMSFPLNDQFNNELITNLLSCGIEIEFPIGSIEITPSREHIQYSNRTKQAITDKLNTIIKEVAAELNGRFNSCVTLFDAHKLYGSVFDYGSNLYALRGLVKSSLQFNGQPVTSARLQFNEPMDGEFSLRQYEKTYRGNKVKSWTYYSIECSDATVLIDNDLNITAGITNRVWNLVQNGKRVYVLSYRTPADKDAFLASSGLEASNFVLLSSLPKISLATATGASPKNAKHSSKEFIFDLTYAASASSWHRKNSDYWAKETVDVANDSGVYVILDAFKYQAKNGGFDVPSGLNSIITSLTTFGITIPKIYGFKEAKRAAVEANTKMVSLWTFIETELTNYFVKNKVAQKLADRLEFDRNENQNWLSSASKITKDVDANSVFAKIATAFESMKHTKSKTILDEAIKWKAYYSTTEKPQQDLTALAEEMNTTYPLFPHIRYWESDKKFREPIVQYINLLG